VKQEKNQDADDGLMGGHGQKEKRDDAHSRADPETLYREIVNVSAALDRWPGLAFEPAVARSGRIREPKRLQGAALNRKPGVLSTGKPGYVESAAKASRNMASNDPPLPFFATTERAFSAAGR
jgi:hypothetical protein